MRYNKIVLSLFIWLVFALNSFAKDRLNINFNDLEIEEFIKISSKIINKNILLTSKIKGKVDFISNAPLYKEDLEKLVLYILESKGYTLIENKNILRVVKFEDILKYNKEEQKKVVEIKYLKNGESKTVIKILNDIIEQKKYKDDMKPFISVDEESNSIILIGTKSEIEYFSDVINKLDIDRQQVYVKARIIEVSEKRTRDVGIKYGLNGFTKTSGGLASFSSTLNGGSSFDVNSLSSYGFNISSMASGLSLGMSINLLNQNGAADIISEPSLLCINNKESSIYVGETISIKTGTTTTSSGIPTDTYTREDIGLTLKVKPRISSGEKVLLEISTKMEDVSVSITNNNPNTSKKNLVTTAIVNNGESIILGGYIREKNENIEEKIPFFGDIPILGSLFKNNREIEDKINLVIIITPYIVPKSKDLTYIRNQLSQLKLLEDKYTKDTIKRLEITKLKNNESIEENNSKTIKNNTRVNDNENNLLHEQRLKEVFGI